MNPTTRHEKRTRWLALWRGLNAVRFDPLPSEEDLRHVLAGLPQRQAGEPLSDWLERGRQPSPASRRGVVLPFRRPRLRPLAEIRLKAAAGELYALPQHPIETPDHDFRLTISQTEDGLQVLIEALGLAIDRYAGQYIGIAASADPQTLVVALQLDEEGEGSVLVDDDEPTRKVLCVKPVVCLIEQDDA